MRQKVTKILMQTIMNPNEYEVELECGHIDFAILRYPKNKTPYIQKTKNCIDCDNNKKENKL
mgnify:CR=1 FL=1